MAPTKGGHKHERNLRRKSKGELNYMFATLVIEKDNDSDEDFVLERIDDEDEEENLENSDPEPERALFAARGAALAEETQGGESRDFLRGDVVDDSCGAKITEHVEYTPRKRTSKHVEELEGMAVSCDKVVKVVVPFPSVEISSWEEFNNVFSDTREKIISTFVCTAVAYNSSHVKQMPTEFEWTHRVYRCTHGIAQGSRSKGHRNRKSRYCGYKARFTPTVTETVAGVYRIIIRNEVRQSDFNCTYPFSFDNAYWSAVVCNYQNVAA
ncbi:hypothetical protein GN958_ATG20718 [Phytophthora infestans]|uniref:Uncharacterized protein n=1 Tax=Phytophthora infestans TaxID=4787 RepID=A0A8S9TTL5_PHYIN|nr:hypothetical protein GN958_ATG20718 [Phytophthora infestans]